MAVVDEDMVAHMLVKNAVLVCQYGGLIRIEKVAEQEESPKEELEWIPSYVMQLGGNRDSEKELTSRIETLNQSIKDSSLIWNQAKIDYLWEICKEFYENYGIQVDPRILLDIICDEGTGSFDTSITVSN